MERKPGKNWWFLAVNGLIAILFGLLLLLFSKEVIQSVVFFIGLTIAIAGLIFFLTALILLKKDKGVAMIIVQAVLTLAIGSAIMIFRESSVDLFFILLGVWAIIVGIFQLVILVNIRKQLRNKNIILFNGLLTIALGVVLFFHPFAFAVLLIKMLGGFATIFGLLMIYLSFTIRKATMRPEIGSETPSSLS
jgi:uncharacterized membrane protein HdeD (DUF308 family)